VPNAVIIVYILERSPVPMSRCRPPPTEPLVHLGIPPPCAMAAFCSWKRSPSRWEPFMCLSTHRITQLSSREVRDLLSKPLTQWSKHCWTRLEYICGRGQPMSHGRLETEGGGGQACVHKLLHLLLLHARLQLALFVLVKAGGGRLAGDAQAEGSHVRVHVACCRCRRGGGCRGWVVIMTSRRAWRNSGSELSLDCPARPAVPFTGTSQPRECGRALSRLCSALLLLLLLLRLRLLLCLPPPLPYLPLISVFCCPAPAAVHAASLGVRCQDSTPVWAARSLSPSMHP